jgi:hypothetical protein
VTAHTINEQFALLLIRILEKQNFTKESESIFPSCSPLTSEYALDVFIYYTIMHNRGNSSSMLPALAYTQAIGTTQA